MIDLSKRRLLLGAAASTLAACDRQGSAPSPTLPASAPSAAAAAAPLPPALKAAWVYAGPVADAGGTFAHERGRRAVEAALGKRVETSFVENAARAGAAGPALRDLAARGNQLIFATSSSLMATVHEVAAEFPDVKFELIDGQRTTDNLRPCHLRSFEGAYLAGMVAGGVTKAGLIGFVGGRPSAAQLRNLNAFALGAQAVNPGARTRVAWAGTSFDPQKEREAAQQLMDSGADVLLQGTDSTAVVQAAESRGKHAFGWQSDMSAFAPRAHLASWVADWGPQYIGACQDMISGQWTAAPVERGLKEGQGGLINLAELIRPELRARLDSVVSGLREARAAVFSGPLVDNAGRQRLAAGAVPDRAWLDKVDFYVKGIDGKAPTSSLPS